ncbi:MAG: TonB-dependent receptor [Verrucomicrobiales bacterium]|nr:TonB-dependent receptor [Verrucomicrobiales bacterium]
MNFGLPSREPSRSGHSQAGSVRGLWIIAWVASFWLASAPLLFAAATNTTLRTPDSLPSGSSELVEISGQVEVALSASAAWQPARLHQPLPEGSRIRTLAQSRATLQFSDRSVLRLGPSSLLVLQPPRSTPATRRFLLELGRLFFLHREAPSDVEFEIPLAIGAIRGTEFVLESSPGGDRGALTLLDGAVVLQQGDNSVRLSSGDQVELTRQQPPRVTRVLIAQQAIQWCLYYPAVFYLPDLNLAPADRTVLQASLAAWQRGSIPDAIRSVPQDLPPVANSAAQLYLAALQLAAGEVDEAQRLLDSVGSSHPLADALREVMAAVRFQSLPHLPVPATASGWLARSYYHQSQSQLTDALAAARTAVSLASDFGFAWIRLAELHLAFANRRAAEAALNRGLGICPDAAPGHALQGFLHLHRYQVGSALTAFDLAAQLDGALGNAWLGRALALGQQGDADNARRALQVAAALEPQRAELRSYLGKAWAEAGDSQRAQHELDLARRLDPGDPTPWLYAALDNFQNRRPNDAVRDLERSIERNDNRSVFRSRLLLDQDRATRNADLAALYHDVGLEAPARQLAARAIQDDYANFSAHLFLARALQENEDPTRARLRLETPRQNELLLANLLAPPGAGNLSLQLSQQDHLRYFGPRPFGLQSITEYASDGDTFQSASAFGSLERFSYALDFQYASLEGDHPNAIAERTAISLQTKYAVAPDDELYLQIGGANGRTGDPFLHEDPTQTDPDLRAVQRQEPHLYAGWHHSWAPGHHTLVLASWLRDRLQLTDPTRAVPFLRQSAGQIVSVDSERAIFDLRQDSQFDLRSIDAQHVWTSPEYGLVAGARYQDGDLDNQVSLDGPLPPPFARQHVESALERVDVYADAFWRPIDPLHLSAGVGFHHLRYPANADLPPLSSGNDSRDLVAPRFGAVWDVLPRTHLRAAYSQSLGGLYFDDSLRLEPTQIAGFTTAYRSLIPESVAGLIPGSRFETAAVGLDHSFTNGLFLGIDFQRLRSDGRREIGAAANSLPIPLPDTVSSTVETIDLDEHALGAYAAMLLGRDLAVGVRYQLADRQLEDRYPDIPDTAAGLDQWERDLTSRLHTVALSARFHHPTGWFAEWHSVWRHQNNDGVGSSSLEEDFWQHHVFAGYRFPRQRAEVRLGILNITDTDYRLNPLSLDLPLPRERTFTVSLKLNF